MATASCRDTCTKKNPFSPQNKHSKLTLLFSQNLTMQNFSYSCSHISNPESKLINSVRLHGTFNYGCTICLHHPLGTQKNQFVQFVQNTKSPFGKITLQLNQQFEHLPAMNVTRSLQHLKRAQELQLCYRDTAMRMVGEFARSVCLL